MPRVKKSRPPHGPVASLGRRGARPANLFIFALLAFGVALRIVHFPVAVYTPDEDAYANFYATPMFENGLGQLPKLVRDYNARPDLWEFPSPTRAGHLWAIVGFMNLAGHATIQSAAWVSAIASMLSLVLIARIGVRFLDPWAAVIALLFAAVSPLDLAMARRVWGDELLALCVLVSLWAFLEHGAAPRRARWPILCLIAAGYSILVKETGLLALGLATLGLALVAWRGRGARSSALALLAGAATLAASLAALAAACGGLEPLRATFARAASAGHVNEYMRNYQTGGPGYYVRGLALLQPLPALLGCLAAVPAALRSPVFRKLAERPRSRFALVTLGGFAIAFAAAALVYPQKNLRFLSPLYAPLDLLAAALVRALAAWLRARLPAPAFRLAAGTIALSLLAAAAADHHRFIEYFIRRGIPDLATPWFTRPPG